MSEKTFEDVFADAKSAAWYDDADADRLLEMFGRAVPLAETRDHLRCIEIVMGFRKLEGVRERFYVQYSKEIEALRYITCSA